MAMNSICRKLIDKYSGSVDYLEIRQEEHEYLAIVIDDGRETISRKRKSGYAVRVIHEGGVTFASIIDPEALDETISELIALSPAVSSGAAALSPAEAVCLEHRPVIKTDPRDVPLAGKLEFLRKCDRIMKDFSSCIVTTDCRYDEFFSRVSFFNTDGAETYREVMDLGAKASVTANRDEVTQRDLFSVGSADDYAAILALENEIPGICEMAVKLTAAPRVKGGRYPVIMDQALTGVFIHEAFGHKAEADHFVIDDKKMEMMALGRRIGSSKLNVFDSGLVAGRGYVPFDDEGVTAEKTYLIKNGLIAGHLHSRLTASKMGARSTGSARAINYRHPPIVRMRSTCVEPGNDTLQDMLRSTGLGLYCRKALGGGSSGDSFVFSPVYGYMVRDGKLGELVRDIELSGDLFKTLLNIDMVGDDFRLIEDSGGCGKRGQYPLPCSFGGPHVRISDVLVGGE